MGRTAPLLFRFDRWDGRLGILRTFGAVEHEEALDGTDGLSFSCDPAPDKGDRLLWRDPDTLEWRESEVTSVSEPVSGPARVRCSGSLCELARDFVEEKVLVRKTGAQALAAALETTRWEMGEVGVGGALRGCVLYHMDALSAARKVARVWGGELEPEIEMDGGRVSRRSLSMPARRGRWRGARFSYGKNLRACTRTVGAGEVYTALYGFGKGVAILDEEGNEAAWSRRLDFSEANGGSKWVGDEDARLQWGRWDAARSERVHAFGSAVFPEVTDAGKLLALTEERLAEVSSPSITWAVDAALVEGGVPIALGDDVAVQDGAGRHVRARVARLTRSFGEGACRRGLVLANARAVAEAERGGEWNAESDGSTGSGDGDGGPGGGTVTFHVGTDDDDMETYDEGSL